jgi:hypothetical protein
VNAITGYLEKFGSNFIVASVIPSLSMVLACLWVFDPIFQTSAALHAKSGIFAIFDISIWVIVITIIIGYTLTALNTYILKVFEGYVLLDRRPFLFMRRGYAKKAQKLIEERDAVKNKIDLLQQKKNKSQEEERALNTLKNSYYALVVEYDQYYPPPNAEIMPTKFGNILKASEAYSSTRYGIDGVQFWPRLWHVIPDSYRQTIIDARNELSFLVNMSALSVVFYLLCVIALLYNTPVPGTTPNWVAIFDDSIRYIFAGTLAFLVNRFFNRAAIFSVSDFGVMIRSAYDLFRLDLLKQFRLEQPKDSVEEFQIWKNLGELMILGQDYLDFKPLKYRGEKGKK